MSSVIQVTIQDTIVTRLLELMPEKAGSVGNEFRDKLIVNRTLRASDANGAIGVFPVDWLPVEGSLEIAGASPPEPLLQRYTFRIQNMVKAADEVQGRAEYATDSKKLRAILYRDPELRIRLRAIQENDLESTEQVTRYGVRQQRFLNNEVSGSWLYLATTELWIETSNTPT